MKKRNSSIITRSSSHSLKFSNVGKISELSIFLKEYRRVLQLIIDNLWENRITVEDKILDISSNFLHCPSVLPSDYLSQFSSFFTARMTQCVGKQACSMVKAAINKRKKQLYMLKKLQNEGKSTKYLQRKIDIQPLVKPNASNANAELDSRFIDFEDSKHFDFFCKVITGNRVFFNLPILHNRVSRKWLEKGELRPSVRLTNNSLILIFSVPKPEKKKEGKIVGCDQGVITAAAFSDNYKAEKSLKYVLPRVLSHYSELGYSFKSMDNQL